MTQQKQNARQSWRNALLVVLLLPIILPLGLISLVFYLLSATFTYLLIWMLWLSRGRDILFVYSDSPIWHEYMTSQILPRVRERAVILNWSDRKKWSWWSLRARAFRLIGGHREFNPMVVLFRPFRRAQTFRFFHPFDNWKHGYKEPLERLTEEMFSVLGVVYGDHEV
jgi:hypothetical protein